MITKYPAVKLLPLLWGLTSKFTTSEIISLLGVGEIREEEDVGESNQQVRVRIE